MKWSFDETSGNIAEALGSFCKELDYTVNNIDFMILEEEAKSSHTVRIISSLRLLLAGECSLYLNVLFF